MKYDLKNTQIPLCWLEETRQLSIFQDTRIDLVINLLCFLVCFSIMLYQFHWKHSPTKRMKPAPNTSTNAAQLDDCGDKPAVAMESMTPSKLQDTIKDPDFMPSKVFLATASAFIATPADPTIRWVSSGLNLVSASQSSQIKSKE